MNKKGFTLIETIIAIAIITILSLVVVPNVLVVIDKNKEKSCNNLIKNIESAAKIYVNNNKYNLEFTCGGTVEIKFQTLVDSGDLKLEDNNTLTNPQNNATIDLNNTVSVTYNCNTNEFLYLVNGINCTDAENDCEGLARPPTITNHVYDGTEKTGVTGGENISIIGEKSATDIGEYNITAYPEGRACWYDDNTRRAIEYNWRITGNSPYIALMDKTAQYTGEKIQIESAIVKNNEGEIIEGIPVIYTYFTGNTCTVNTISDAPIEVGTYSVKAYTNNYNKYTAAESICAKLTITKADATLTTSTSSLSPTYPNIDSFTYNYIGDGTLSCSSSNTTIATCDLDETTKTVTVTPNKKGNLSITISASEGTNYRAVSKTVSVNVKGIANPLVVSPIDGLVYNKSAQTLVTTSNAKGTVYYSTTTQLTSSNYTTGSTTIPKETNAKTYPVYYYTPGTNEYSDASGSVDVTIEKADCECNISSVTTTMKYPISTSGTISYSCTGDGTRNVVSSNTSVIRVGTIGTTSAPLTAVNGGTSKLTVSQASGANYNICTPASRDVTVESKLANPITVSPIEGLVYNKNAQTLVTTSNAKGTVYYSTTTQLTSSNYTTGSTTISKGTNAQTYTVYYYVTGNNDYSEASGSVDVTIEKASCECSISSVPSLKYPDLVSGTLSYNCTGDGPRYVISSNTNVIEVGTKSDNSAELTAISPGTSTLKIEQEEGANYNTCTPARRDVTVSEKDTNPIIVSPIEGLVYNKNAQTLVTTSNAQGTVYYSTTTQLTSSNYTTGSTTISKGTNAQTYTVYYYVTGNNDYSEASGSVDVTIEKASCECSISSVSSLKYPDVLTGTVTYSCNGDGTRNVTSSNTSVIEVGTISPTSANITGLTPGTSTLNIRQEEGANYNECSDATKSVTISERFANTLSVTSNSLTYNGNAQSLVTTTNAQGTVYYSTILQLTSSNYTLGSTSIPNGTNAGTYKVYYYTPGNEDYYDASGSVNVTIEKASCTCSFSSVSTLSYPGAILGTASYSCDGDGIRTLTSSDTSVVFLGEVGITSTSLTGFKAGSSTLTLNQTAGSNYKACSSATYNMTISTTTYIISYDANGGSGAPSSQTKTYGIDLTLSSKEPRRSGYIFLGWSTNKDATNPTYYSGSTFTVNANTTLYAIWGSPCSPKSGVKEFSVSNGYKGRIKWSTSCSSDGTGKFYIDRIEFMSTDYTNVWFKLDGYVYVNDREVLWANSKASGPHISMDWFYETDVWYNIDQDPFDGMSGITVSGNTVTVKFKGYNESAFYAINDNYNYGEFYVKSSRVTIDIS